MMHERLIELLIKSGVTWNPCGVADSLLENGVIVPPCKVGDTVYLTEWWIHGTKWERLFSPIQRTIIYFSIEKDGVYAHLKDGCINVEYFGKTVFLTREAAEEALRGGAE